MTRDGGMLERAVAVFLISTMILGLAAVAAIAVTFDDRQDPQFDVSSGESSSGVEPADPPSEDRDSPGTRSAENSSTPETGGDENAEDGGVPGIDPGGPWFEEASQDSGLVFDAAGRGFGNAPLEGPPTGVYVSDVDRDGWPDVLALNSRETVLFENQEGEFIRSKNLSNYGDFTTALFFDHDNSGYEDLYLMSDERSVFLENEGGRLTPKDVGLPDSFQSVRGASAADYDGDGCLDVFVVQANDWRDRRPAGFDELSVSVDEDNGGRNLLYDGDCRGFENATAAAGIQGTTWSLATSFVDLTRDGLPDIHVANDFNNDVVYVNRGDGTFRREVLPNFTNRNGMSSEVADVTGDGYPEIFVTNIHGDAMMATQRYGDRIEGNNLLGYDPDAGFVDLAPEYGLVEGGLGWAAVIDDLNNDGYLDVLHSATDRTGYEHPALWMGQPNRRELQRINSSAAGLRPSGFVGSADIDYDRDGNIDVVLADTRESYALYRNLNEGSYLQIYVEPSQDQTAIGTRVTVSQDADVTTKYLTTNSDYMSQGWRTLHFGLDDAEDVERVGIRRPDGTTQVLEDVEARQRIVVEPKGEPQ